MIVPLQKNLVMIIMCGLFLQMVVLALWMVKPLLDVCDFQIHHGPKSFVIITSVHHHWNSTTGW